MSILGRLNEATEEDWNKANTIHKTFPDEDSIFNGRHKPEAIPSMALEDDVFDKFVDTCRDYNVGSSDYATRKIQPWDIWLEYNLNPWDADIVKRVLRDKKGSSRREDYEKMMHVCQERIRQIDQYEEEERQYEQDKGIY